MDAPAPDAQAFVPTTATTLDELVRAAYFVAASIDAPVVEVVNPHVINLHYPADGSLATVKVEARAGAWGGIGPRLEPGSEAEAAANARYDAALAASTAPPPVEEEGAARGNENPVYEVQRQ